MIDQRERARRRTGFCEGPRSRRPGASQRWPPIPYCWLLCSKGGAEEVLKPASGLYHGMGAAVGVVPALLCCWRRERKHTDELFRQPRIKSSNPSEMSATAFEEMSPGPGDAQTRARADLGSSIRTHTHADTDTQMNEHTHTNTHAHTHRHDA